ncbi:glycosyltransferase family 9 protein [Persephonella sp.]
MKKVLVIRFSSLGDVILSSAVLNPLYKKGYSVDFLTFKPFDQLFSKDYRINRVIPANRKDLKGFKLIEFGKHLKDYDYILDLHGNIRSIIISKFSKVKTIRYNKNAFKRRLYIYPFFRKFIGDNFSVIYSYLEALKHLGIENIYKYRPEIIITDEEKKAVKKFLPDRFVTLGTGARYRNKIYPYYNRISDILIKKGFNVVLIGSEEDKKIDKNTYPEGVIDLRGKLSIRESLAAISQSILTISNDSAIAHMSRAVKVPVSVIYGATHPYFGFAPLKDEGIYFVKNLSCQPCDLHGKRECKKGKTECLDISPEEIINKALSLIS